MHKQNHSVGIISHSKNEQKHNTHTHTHTHLTCTTNHDNETTTTATMKLSKKRGEITQNANQTQTIPNNYPTPTHPRGQNTSLGRKCIHNPVNNNAMSSVTANKPAKKKILQFDPSLYNIEVDYGVIEVCKVDIYIYIYICVCVCVCVLQQISQESINTTPIGAETRNPAHALLFHAGQRGQWQMA